MGAKKLDTTGYSRCSNMSHVCSGQGLRPHISYLIAWEGFVLLGTAHYMQGGVGGGGLRDDGEGTGFTLQKRW